MLLLHRRFEYNIRGTDEQTRWIHAVLCCAALRPARLVRRLRFLCEKQKGKRAAPVERVGSVHFIYISFLLVDVCVVFRLCRHLIGSPFISAGQDGLR
jgi:hypothetical protein